MWGGWEFGAGYPRDAILSLRESSGIVLLPQAEPPAQLGPAGSPGQAGRGWMPVGAMDEHSGLLLMWVLDWDPPGKEVLEELGLRRCKRNISHP